jgi:tripartite-type tricarboxylate transporter receptor subunit TctC
MGNDVIKKMLLLERMLRQTICPTRIPAPIAHAVWKEEDPMRDTPAPHAPRFLARLAGIAALAATLLAAGAIPAAALAAEPFPSRPVTMLVAFPPGGPADVLARAMQPAMAKLLGQPLVIENLPGAGGALAVQRLLAKPADGYTLIMGSPNEAILAPLSNASAKYKPEELTLIAPISTHPLVVMARNDLPFSSLEELVAAAGKPGSQSLTFGSPGHGSMYHIVSEYLAQTTGAKLLHVPYKGATPMMQDLVGRQIDITILPNLGASIQLLESHKIKAISVLDDRRMRTLPDVPAISESGIAKKSEFVHSVWLAVMARAGIPQERQRVLLEASQQAIQSPEMVKALAQSGVVPMQPQPLAASAKFYADETEKFRKMARSIQLTAQ